MMLNEVEYKNFISQNPAATLAIAERRRMAFKQLQELGLPTRKNELWKYTSLKGISEQDWSLSNSGLSHEQLLKISQRKSAEMLNLVFVDGILDKTLSDDSEIEIQCSDETLQEFSGIDKALAPLFNATSTAAIKMIIQKNQVVSKPVHLMIVFTGTETKQNLSSLQVLIELATQAQLKIVVNQLSVSSTRNECRLMQLYTRVSNGAKLEIFSLQNLNLVSNFIQQANFELHKDSVLALTEMTFGSKLSRLNTEVYFQSENAEATVNACNMISGQQHADQFVSVEHRHGLNRSVQHAKSILSGSSQSVFRGRVFIEKNAQKAYSEQLNNNLLLSTKAKAQSIPQLEIYADDVKAGHGATVGQLSADELFYFQSRGISKTAAQQMLAEGYVKELVFKCEDIGMRNLIQREVKEKLSELITDLNGGKA